MTIDEVLIFEIWHDLVIKLDHGIAEQNETFFSHINDILICIFRICLLITIFQYFSSSSFDEYNLFRLSFSFWLYITLFLSFLIILHSLFHMPMLIIHFFSNLILINQMIRSSFLFLSEQIGFRGRLILDNGH